jgi:hypothetical protein
MPNPVTARGGIVAPTDPQSTMEAVRALTLLMIAIQKDLQYLAKNLGVRLPSDGG